jgi:hypothetical protein
MAVNESQLATWSNRGAAASAETTYTSVKAALNQAPNLKKYEYDVYLQGSYGNATNIYGNSDVDVVAELNSAVYDDLSRLTESEQNYYNQRRTDSSVTFEGFRDDVHQALSTYYGKSLVTPGNKCIAVAGANGRLDADVVPCLEYRLYTRYTQSVQSYISGIKFYTRKEVREVVNYPKPHRENGTAKNQRVSENYKPTVRIFKNWRDRLVGESRLVDGSAPSYFVECLMSNIPDVAYKGKTWHDIVLACLQYLHGANFSTFMCQNAVTPLFGPTPEQWNLDQAQTFRDALIADWNRGR